MRDKTFREELLRHLEHLPPEVRREVLELSGAMARSAARGIPGKQLPRFSGIISPEDANAMEHIIEEGCERVDSDEW